MKQKTISINPELFEKQMAGYAKLTLSNEEPKAEVMEAFREYLEHFYSEILSFHQKNPDKQERFNEYMVRYDILQRVYLRYSDFYYEGKHAKLENIKLKVRLQEANIKNYELQAEIEKLTKTIEGEI